MNLPNICWAKIVNFLDDRGYDASIVHELSEGSDFCYIKVSEQPKSRPETRERVVARVLQEDLK
jgi:uncharacterized metal-binding protein